MAENETLVQEYVRTQGNYCQVVALVKASIKDRLQEENLVPDVQGRAKDPWSLATKLLTRSRKGKPPYPSLADIPDLAGVRVIARHIDDYERIRSAIRDLYPTAIEDDKSASLDPDTFRYRGTHFQVSPVFEEQALRGLECEIQLRTRAEHLWSDLSHELFYKTPGDVPSVPLRRFNRLVALIELFDMEVKATMSELKLQPSYEYQQILTGLEEHFTRLVNHPVGINRELSLGLIESMSHLKAVEQGSANLLSALEAFTSLNDRKLRLVYERVQRTPGANPFYMQPESLLLWYLVENCKYELMDEWTNAEWDKRLLYQLSTEWGVTLPDE